MVEELIADVAPLSDYLVVDGDEDGPANGAALAPANKTHRRARYEARCGEWRKGYRSLEPSVVAPPTNREVLEKYVEATPPRTSTRSYFVHHTQRISVAAQQQSAASILRSIRYKQEAEVGCRCQAGQPWRRRPPHARRSVIAAPAPSVLGQGP